MTLHISRRLVLVASLAASGLFALNAGFAASSVFQPYSKTGFEAALKGAKPVLVHVHADWCPICRKQEIVLNELAKGADFKKLVAIKVDFDMDTDFKKAHNVANQSIIIAFKGGKETSRLAGVTDAAKIAEFVAAAAK